MSSLSIVPGSNFSVFPRFTSPQLEANRKVFQMSEKDIKTALSSTIITPHLSMLQIDRLIQRLEPLSQREHQVWEVISMVEEEIWDEVDRKCASGEAKKIIAEFVKLLAMRSATMAKKRTARSE